MKNSGYKDRGIGTQAEKLAVRYVFNELDIPTARKKPASAGNSKTKFTIIPQEKKSFRIRNCNQEAIAKR